ncbi:MAG: NAD(P)-binding domain-containing protein [Roseibium sp.]|uniref:NAD(P)-binding domain-containing protein n=1 Tax=Roseibium sp. TaxID=1936156 RepID=UPI003D9C3579
MRIGVLGCGAIACAVVHGIAGDGHRITVSERSASRARQLANTYENVIIADNQGVIDASDVIILGLMAEVASEVLAKLDFRAGQKVISLMAGATLEQADALVQPAYAVALVMPFPGIALGGSPVMMQGDAELVQELFGSRNSIFVLENPDEMAAYLCAQAVLSPVVRMVSDAADWLGDRVSDKEQGETFLRELVASNLANSACKPLIEALNTPGGYNQRLRLHMEASGVGETLKAGLNALK